ncbi:MAG: hypothetical protein JO068_00415, partial [Hyphomicrobiales bacterium]|nr:hypothetical protein [Hyphomicrobiales bacterium]
MAYFITGFSYVPQYCPQFDPINEDGSKFFDPKNEEVSDYQGCRGLSFNALKTGHRLDETTNPTPASVYRFAKMAGATKILPDIFHAGPEICVNQKVKDAIEVLEPSEHQFLPITLMRTKKKAFEGSYYLLVIGQALDSVIFEESNLRWQVTRSGSKYVQPGINPEDYRTLWKSKITAKHLWRERMYLRDIYISDQLYQKLMELKVRGIDARNYRKALEKDGPNAPVPQPNEEPLSRSIIKFIRG